MHNMDANKTLRENARLEVHKNATGYFKQILQATLKNALVVRPLTSHLTKHPISQNISQDMKDNAGETRMNSQVLLFYGLLHIEVSKLTDQQGLIYIRSVWTLDTVWKTFRKWWMIRKGGERKREKEGEGERSQSDKFLLMIMMLNMYYHTGTGWKCK